MNAERELDGALVLCLFAIGLALGAAVSAQILVEQVRRDAVAARTARERAQQETADLRRQLDGALENLHDAAIERDDLRIINKRLTDPES